MRLSNLLLFVLFVLLSQQSIAQSSPQYINGTDTLLVYKSIPNLTNFMPRLEPAESQDIRAISNKYTIRVRSAATNNVWVDVLALYTYNRAIEIPDMNMIGGPNPGTNSSTSVQHYPNATAGWSQTYGNIEMSNNQPVEVEISPVVNGTDTFKIDGKSFYKATVHPVQKASVATVVNGKIYFTISNPAQVAIDINGQMDDYNAFINPIGVPTDGVSSKTIPLHTITLFANPIIKKPVLNSSRTFYVDNGVMPTVSPSTYDTLYFKPGVHDIGLSNKIYPGKAIYIPGDAIVYGSLNNIGVAYSGFTKVGERIKIFGYGTISGARGKHSYYVPTTDTGIRQPIYIDNGLNYQVSGITIADGAQFSLWTPSGSGGLVSYVKVIGWRANGDGLGNGDNVNDCFVRTNDDCSYVRGNRKRVTYWKDNISAIFYMSQIWETTPILIEDCDILYCRSRGGGGAAWDMRADAPAGQRPAQVTFRNIRFHDSRANMEIFNLVTFKGDAAAPTQVGGNYNWIKFENISIKSSLVKSKLLGCAAAPWNGGLTFDNVTFAGSLLTEANFSSYFNTNEYVNNIVFKPFVSFNITTSVNGGVGGNASGGGTYVQGQSINVTAIVTSGYRFVNWTEGGVEVSTNSSYNFSVTQSRNLVANFELIPVAPNATDITAAVNGNWSVGTTWIGGVVPTSIDNVITNNKVITVDVDATCANLYLGVAAVVSPASPAVAAAANTITINANKTLTVRGIVDAFSVSSVDVFGLSNATSTLKFTGKVIPNPVSGNVILTTDNAIQCIKPKNIIYAAEDSRVYQIQSGVGNYSIHLSNSSTVSSGKMTVKIGTNLVTAKNTVLGQGTQNELIVEAGAMFTTTTQLRGSSTNTNYHVTKATIDGTVVHTGGGFTIYNLVLGSSGKLVTNASNKTNAWELIYDGWWGSVNSTELDVNTGKIATPAMLSFAAGSTIEFNRTSAQNINGMVPTNTLAGYTGTPTVAAYTIPYSNLKISGGSASVKTVQSNLSVTGTLEVAINTVLLIPAGISLNLAAGAKIINNGTVTNNGNITFQSDATNGTATFTGNAISGTGTVNVNQSLQHPAGTLRSWYVSSPVAATTAPTPALSVIKSFDETNATGIAWTSNSTMAPKVGYMITPALAANNLLFTGALNDGNQSISITRRAGTENKPGFNLIGNPYLSYLDWTAVCAYTDGVTPNNSIMPTSTMWYRTKATGSWGFVTVNGDGISSPTGVVTKYIPPMQAFWVRALNVGTSTLKLTNAMRSHTDAVNNPSPNKLKAPAVNNTTIVRLQVCNGTATDEAVIYFSENAQNEMDKYDAPKISNDNVAIPELFTTLGTERIVINAMKNLVLDTPIGLGFVAGNASSFTLKVNELSNLPEGVKMILKDNVTKLEMDLTDGVSTFTFSPELTANDRFSVIFRSASSATGLTTIINGSLSAYYSNSKITVFCSDDKLLGSDLSVYNAVGQRIVSKQLNGSKTQVDGIFVPGVYVLKVANTTTKVIVR